MIMKIVIDTNVLISGVFFGGFPRTVLSAVVGRQITACATMEIINEYEKIIQEMVERKQGHINKNILQSLIQLMDIIDSVSHIKLSRDPKDDKFIECAKDAHALYIVSGDKDLLVLRQYEDIKIVTAKDFCEKYLL